MISNREITTIEFRKIKMFFSDVDGTLTDGFTYYTENGECMKRFNHKDGRGNYLLKENGIKFGIISGEDTNIVVQRARKVKADFCFLGIQNKLKFLSSFCKKENLSLDEIAYIGDDTNDLEVIANVGLSFAVKDSMPQVLLASNYICSRKGGDGAFREAVEFLLEKIGI